jgi:beta-glucosidase
MITKNKPPLDLEKSIDELLEELTLKEKISLLSGKNNWSTMPVERLGIPPLIMTDGPHGVRADPSGGRIMGPTTAFPTGVSFAATWNPELIEIVGETLAAETRAMGCDILLGPCVNIVRHPLAGRNFESYSEDPFLAGSIGAAWVNGLQNNGIGASLKHFACNNQEEERFRGNSVVDERTFREIYLAQFEMIVKASDPWTIMCSYNRLNGEYASQNSHLLTEVLRNEWDYQGLVISDWGANHTITESIQGGLDLEMPGPAKYYGNFLYEAVLNWQIDEKKINEAVRRVLNLIYRSEKFKLGHQPLVEAVNTEAHHLLAKEVAEEAITLLKNDNHILPLNIEKIKKIGIIGPSATDIQVGGGGSSYVEPQYRSQPLAAITNVVAGKVEIGYEKGCDNLIHLVPAKSKFFRTPNAEGEGLWGEYFAGVEFSGKPLMSRMDSRVDFWWLSFAPMDTTPESFSVRWTGKLIPEISGRHTLAADNTGICKIWLDDLLIIDHAPGTINQIYGSSEQSIVLDLEAGKEYPIKIEYIRQSGLDFPHIQVLFGYTPLPEDDNRLEKAVLLAEDCDVTVVFVGFPEGYETEGRDRPNLELTGRQNELVEAVASANSNTIVVINAGSPISMPWIDKVAGILFAYYPGLEGGNAIAEILFGQVNPSGKLPVTFPRNLYDSPAYLHYPGDKDVYYGEGIFVGYRHYDIRHIEPLFPFGYGQSYTNFVYKNLVVPEKVKVGESIQVNLEVVNSGSLAGKEIVQVYVHDNQSSLIRPIKELKGFSKVSLNPGESKRVTIELDKRAFAYYNPDENDWIIEPGIFTIMVGSSSIEIHLQAEIVVEN